MSYVLGIKGDGNNTRLILMVIKDSDFWVWFFNSPPTESPATNTSLGGAHGTRWAWLRTRKPQLSPQSHHSSGSCTWASQTSQMSPTPFLRANISGGIGGLSLLPLSSFASIPSRTFWNRETPPLNLQPSTTLPSSTCCQGDEAFIRRLLTSLIPGFVFLVTNREPIWGWNLKTGVGK